MPKIFIKIIGICLLPLGEIRGKTRCEDSSLSSQPFRSRISKRGARRVLPTPASSGPSKSPPGPAGARPVLPEVRRTPSPGSPRRPQALPRPARRTPEQESAFSLPSKAFWLQGIPRADGPPRFSIAGLNRAVVSQPEAQVLWQQEQPLFLRAGMLLRQQAQGRDRGVHGREQALPSCSPLAGPELDPGLGTSSLQSLSACPPWALTPARPCHS